LTDILKEINEILSSRPNYSSYIQSFRKDNFKKSFENRYLANGEKQLWDNLISITSYNFIKTLFLNTSIFYNFWEESNNYIQIAGPNLIDELSNPAYTKKKVWGYVHPFVTNNVQDLKAKKFIPKLNYAVERNKIFYGTNFNRELGFLKTIQFSRTSQNKELQELAKNTKNNPKKSISNKTMEEVHKEKMFGIYISLVPDNCIKALNGFISKILQRLKSYNYTYNLFKFCPISENKDKWLRMKNHFVAYLEDVRNKSNKVKLDNNDYITLIHTTVDNQKVFSFIKDFLSYVLPEGFIGNKNLEILFKKVKIFIDLNRFESFNKVNLFDNKEFSFEEMEWIKTPNMTSHKFKKYGILLKNFMMKNTIFWIFDYLVVQLLRSHFYITERASSASKTFYYHKIVWDILMKIQEIKTCDTFQPIEKSERNLAINELMSRESAFGKMRLVPKPSSCRPIVSYKTKIFSINKDKRYLKDEFANIQRVFKYIQTNKMQLKDGSCVIFDYKATVQRLIEFKKLLMQNKIELGETIMNYLTLDIEKCYDNINLNKLQEILNDTKNSDDIIKEYYYNYDIFLIIPKNHVLKNINKMQNDKDKDNLMDIDIKSKDPLVNCSFSDSFEIKKMFVIAEQSELLGIFNFIKNNNQLNCKNCIIYPNFKKNTILLKLDMISMILKVIQKNYVKFNKKFFTQIKGIPQGLTISSFLCNLYFYYLEKKIVEDIQKEKHYKGFNLMMRFMDDYLFMSNNCLNHKNLILELTKVSQANGFNFNYSKSKLNFDIDIKSFKNKMIASNTSVVGDKKESNDNKEGNVMDVINENYNDTGNSNNNELNGFVEDSTATSTSNKAENIEDYNGITTPIKKVFKKPRPSTRSKSKVKSHLDKNNIEINQKDNHKSNNKNNGNHNPINTNHTNNTNTYTNNTNTYNNNTNHHHHPRPQSPNKNSNKKAKTKTETETTQNTIQESNTISTSIIKQTTTATNSKQNNEFSWNGINFMLNTKNYFNISQDYKNDFENTSHFSTLMNLRIPEDIKFGDNLGDFIFRRCSGILLTGHPWIYFFSELNENETLFNNLKQVSFVVFNKLIFLLKLLQQNNILPSENLFIDKMDNAIRKFYFIMSNKTNLVNGKNFFIDFKTFILSLYMNGFDMYFDNPKLIRLCPFLFKSIRRKILRMIDNEDVRLEIIEKMKKLRIDMMIIDSQLSQPNSP